MVSESASKAAVICQRRCSSRPRKSVNNMPPEKPHKNPIRCAPISVFSSPVPVYINNANPPTIGPTRYDHRSCDISLPRQTNPATTPSAANTAVDAPMERCVDSSSKVLSALPEAPVRIMASQATPDPSSRPANRPKKTPKMMLPMRWRRPECSVSAVMVRHHSPARTRTPSIRPAASQSWPK